MKLLAKLGKRKNKALIITGLVTGLPIAMLAVQLAVLSVDAPFWDQWIYADLLKKLHTGTLAFNDLWHQHNEHRIFFPKLIQLAVAAITNWNVRFEIIMNMLAALGAYGLMVWIAWKTFRSKLGFAIGAIIIAWLLFSPLAYINWIWGFQFVWFFSVLALTATIWALYRSKDAPGFDKWFWAAAACAVLCNYSIGNGLLVWVVGCLMLFVYHANRQKILTWAGIGTAAITLYFYHLNLAGGSLAILLQRPLDVAQYTLQYLGHPLGATSGAALIAGVLLLITGAVSVLIGYKQKLFIWLVPWLALAGYGLLTAFMAAATRLGPFGVEHSMVFSYTTISVLFSIGVVMMAIIVAARSWPQIERWSAAWLVGAGCVVGLAAYPLATGYTSNYLTGLQKMKEQSQHLKKVRACLYAAKSETDPCLLHTFNNQKEVWEKLQFLKSIHWGDF